jgi:hypothetical protein
MRAEVLASGRALVRTVMRGGQATASTKTAKTSLINYGLEPPQLVAHHHLGSTF